MNVSAIEGVAGGRGPRNLALCGFMRWRDIRATNLTGLVLLRRRGVRHAEAFLPFTAKPRMAQMFTVGERAQFGGAMLGAVLRPQ